MITYIPKTKQAPKVVNVPSAWDDIPTILNDIITRFKIKTDKALEFGVDQGYSTSALANYFKKVTGVDTFAGTGLDAEKNPKAELNNIKEVLKDFDNIELVQSTAEKFIKSHPNNRYNLIHIDLSPHTYKNLLPIGKYAVAHSNCVIIHDTELSEMIKLCEELSAGFDFYNYPESHGLGILVKK